MPSDLRLWSRTSTVQICNNDLFEESVLKINNIDHHLYLLTASFNLYHGLVDESSKEPQLYLELFENAKFSDFQCSCGNLYGIDLEGRVLQYSPDLEPVREIPVAEDSKVCPHGRSGAKTRLRIEKLSVGTLGTLFLTDSGHLWASGDMPQIGVSGPQPQKVAFFEGHEVYDFVVGDDLAVAVVGKAVRSDDTDSGGCDEDVFVPSCPLCVSTSRMNSPGSVNCDITLDVLKESGMLSLSDLTDSVSTSSRNESSSSPSNSKDRNSCSQLSENTESSDCSEKIEKNIIFRNTEAARDFLTRQFSWMSAGEEYLAECTEIPTRIIKENVTNMATFVYEGVKTVGDKVVTLSRHVSGSSDNCDVPESIDDVSLPRITSKDEFMWSLSQGTSEKELSEHDIKERYNTIVKYGANLLNTEVWTWGNVTHGQLGVGDSIKRERPMIVSKLSGIGAKKVSAGASHVAVLTLDGRALLWGRNDHNQVTLENNSDQSSPRQFPTSADERICDIACGTLHTAILNNKLSLKYIGKQEHRRIVKLLKMQEPTAVPDYADAFNDIELQAVRNRNARPRDELLSSADYILLNPKVAIGLFALDTAAEEQNYLDQMLAVHLAVIKPLQKQNMPDTQIYDQLVDTFTDLLYFTAANLMSLLEFTSGNGNDYDILLFKCIEEHIHVYKKYLIALNDVVSLGGFPTIANVISVPQTLYQIRSHGRAKNKKKDKANPVEIVQDALMLPLNRLYAYPEMICLFLNGAKKEARFQDLLLKWSVLNDEQEQRLLEAKRTNDFWLNSGKAIEHLRSPNRRLIRDSHSHPIQIHNAGRFSSHWIVLLTDVLVHMNGSTPHVHYLTTVWVEVPNDDSYSQNLIYLKMPEDTLVLHANNPEQKAEWLQAVQNAIKTALDIPGANQPPSVRTARHTFAKSGFAKDARYRGRWYNTKMHGTGQLEWPDRKVYTGQFSHGQMQGYGRMEIPNTGVYEGQWKQNQQSGFGVIKYTNGDTYKGFFKEGQAHGHGSLKQGSFMASAASIYIGEWLNGTKNGYGVMDDIVTGEKYLGNWLDNKKHGSGLIVTADGVYYEGTFHQDVFTGRGLMILEDGTHYEGEFKGIGNLNGKGTLTLNSGHTVEGNLTGSLDEGIKISSGTLNLTKLSQTTTNDSVGLAASSSPFAKLCTPVTHKWKALFRQCHQVLGIADADPKHIKTPDTQRIWQNIAIVISNSYRGTVKRGKTDRISDTSLNNLDTIPTFGRSSIDVESYAEVKRYLSKAFDCPHHPLGSLLADVSVAYTTTYGGLRAHPLLLTHAVAELHSITKRIYEIILLLFPALPDYDKEVSLDHGKDGEVISYQSLLYPVLLPKIYSSIFVLYTLHNKHIDLQYWKRLVEWNKHSDYTLMAFLSVNQKFLGNPIQEPFLPSPARDVTFVEAVETLQLLKTTFSPLEKLFVIRQTFEKMTQAVQVLLGHDYKWSMDDLIPVFLYVVVRARILQLGSETHFIENFMEPSLENGELGIMFATLNACYKQILQEKTSIS